MQTKQATAQQVVSMYTPRRLKAPFEPPEVQDNIRVTKSVQFDLPLTETTVGTPITVARIAAAVPGGLTYWTRIRVSSMRIYSQDVLSAVGEAQISPTLRVDFSSDGVNAPTVSWSDQGTSGQRRAAIAFAPGLRVQSEWFGTSQTTTICNVRLLNGSTILTGHSVLVQAVIELLSPNLN